ncbi:hypothetical protein NPIL_173821 [Nephila pilipes]|uniref:Uncharacterized protein n=1 Tax=Nephila pilipes TaxID=299642 RepID=A0A8X6NBS1_NEPPI|nr:hypothetical protein NPIL_173821 [Nephila pilipes]
MGWSTEGLHEKINPLALKYLRPYKGHSCKIKCCLCSLAPSHHLIRLSKNTSQLYSPAAIFRHFTSDLGPKASVCGIPTEHPSPPGSTLALVWSFALSLSGTSNYKVGLSRSLYP